MADEMYIYKIPNPPPCPHCGERYPEIRMASGDGDTWRVGERRNVLCPNCESVVQTLTRKAETRRA